MIASLKGKIIEKRDTALVLDVAGVGYLVFVPARELAQIAMEDEVRLHTHLVVKEDALDIYGSREKANIDAFKLLLNVKGIGPKSALAVLSLIEPRDLTGAVQSANSEILVNLGVTKKTADRIVLELKNKVAALAGIVGAVQGLGAIMESEALQALEALGYSREKARQALKESEGEDVSAKVKSALRILGKG